MMEIHQVDASIAVGPQPKPAELAELAKSGVVAVICNRPDGEEEGQANAATMRAAAEEAGMAFHHLPTDSGLYSAPAIAAFRAIREGTPGPVFAYCRTGKRAIVFETLANPHNLPADERLRRAQDAGYDLTDLKDRLSD